jgi:hypothetical protein
MSSHFFLPDFAKAGTTLANQMTNSMKLRKLAPQNRPKLPPTVQWGHYLHRNLSTRTSMFKLLLQTFWAKKTLVKSLLFSTLDKAIYNIVTFLQGSTKPLLTTQNRVEIS